MIVVFCDDPSSGETTSRIDFFCLEIRKMANGGADAGEFTLHGVDALRR